jgi:hypothetical protein
LPTVSVPREDILGNDTSTPYRNRIDTKQAKRGRSSFYLSSTSFM